MSRLLKNLNPWCYLEHGSLYRKDDFIIFENKNSVNQIPMDSFAMILIGPGVSISSNCLSHMGKYNGIVVISSSSAVPKMLFSASPSSGNFKLTEKQANLYSTQKKRLDIAQQFCEMRFPQEKERIKITRSFKELLGVEGSIVKKVYKEVFGKEFIRNYEASDSINKLINIGNNALYSYAYTICLHLGLSPHLGFYHRTRKNGLLFDLGDCLKTKEYYDLIQKYSTLSINESLKKLANIIYGEKNRQLIKGVLNVFGENKDEKSFLDSFGEWVIFDP